MSDPVIIKTKHEVTLPMTGRIATWNSRDVTANVMSMAVYPNHSPLTSCIIIAIITAKIDGEKQSTELWCKEEWNDVGPILNVIYDWFISSNKRAPA